MGIQIRGECDGCHRTQSYLKERRVNDSATGRQLFLCGDCYDNPRKYIKPEFVSDAPGVSDFILVGIGLVVVYAIIILVASVMLGIDW